MGAPAEKAAFDTQCNDVAGAALDALGPAKYPLPEWRGFENDLREARRISAGLREAVWRDDEEEKDDDDEQQQQQADGNEKARLEPADKARSLVLLLDQFTRNTMRDPAGQALVYTHYDRLARALVHCILGVAHGVDSSAHDAHDVRGLDAAIYADNPARRSWFYMPLMHSESLADHALYRERMEEVGKLCGADQGAKEYVMNGLGFAKRHEVILERFGRYPHRNGVLGREGTEEERRWEEEGGDNFGTK